jgi:hypothetical protein
MVMLAFGLVLACGAPRRRATDAGPLDPTGEAGASGASGGLGGEGGAPAADGGLADLRAAADAAGLADAATISAADAAGEDDVVPRGEDAGRDRAGEGAFDAAGPAGDPCPGYKKGTHTQAGVSAAAFCAAYAKTCTYEASGPRFADAADCQATYLGATEGGRTCLAGHLCEAVVSTGASGRSSNCQAAAHGAVCR